MRRNLLWLAALLVALAGAPQTSLADEQITTCDRACLIAIGQSYLAALTARDPHRAPIAPNVKFVENAAQIPVGEGLWYGAGPSRWDLAILAADPASGEIGFLGAIAENEKPVILVLRLKVEDSKITEIEHRVERNLPPSVIKALITADVFKRPIAPSERVSRAEMIRIANAYFDALEQGNASLVPFAANCERYESAERTTHNPISAERAAGMSEHDRKFWDAYRSMGCADQINTNALRHINMLFPRRILVIDEEQSLVYAYPTFVHKGDIQTVEIKNVPGITSLVFPTPPGDTHAGEVFRIRNGKIEGVQVSGARLPYGTKTGW